MGVREHQPIEILAGHGEWLPVAFAPFFGALKESAIEKHFLVIGESHEVFGACHGAGRTAELNGGHINQITLEVWRRFPSSIQSSIWCGPSGSRRALPAAKTIMSYGR